MDVSTLNLNNRKLDEAHHLANARAFLAPGLACLMPYATRAGKRIPGWNGTLASHLATPRLGADFLECELTIAPNAGAAERIVNPYENFMYVVEGGLRLIISGKGYKLGYFWTPPGVDFEASNPGTEPARVVWVRKKYVPSPLHSVPQPIVGNVLDLPGIQSPADYEQHCLPINEDYGFDMAMNMCTYYPGVTMPRTETHICEHVNYFVSGRGIICINGIYHEVFPGDACYIAPYTPHTAAGLAPTALRYLLFKNYNRDFTL